MSTWHDIERSTVPELSAKIYPGRPMTEEDIRRGSGVRYLMGSEPVVGLPPLPLGWSCEVGFGRLFSALGLWTRSGREEIAEQVAVFEGFQGVVLSEWATRKAKYGSNGSQSRTA